MHLHRRKSLPRISHRFSGLRIKLYVLLNARSNLCLPQIKYEENLPGVVCHTCLYKLDMWGEFKEQFIESNKILLEQLEISEASDDAVSSPDTFLLRGYLLRCFRVISFFSD